MLRHPICDFDIDGNANSDWAAGSTANIYQIYFPWGQIDLGDIFQIVKILIWNCTDCCQDKLNLVLQIIAGDGSTIVSSVSYGDVVGTMPITANFGSGVDGQYVKIQSNQLNSWLNIAEVQVYGSHL